MKFNIFFTIRGHVSTAKDVPNKPNPIECVNLAGVLKQLSENLPTNQSLGIETIGVRVEAVDVPDVV
jgi:hypothetical protein